MKPTVPEKQRNREQKQVGLSVYAGLHQPSRKTELPLGSVQKNEERLVGWFPSSSVCWENRKRCPGRPKNLSWELFVFPVHFFRISILHSSMETPRVQTSEDTKTEILFKPKKDLRLGTFGSITGALFDAGNSSFCYLRKL
jgi:hypothetical protein